MNDLITDMTTTKKIEILKRAIERETNHFKKIKMVLYLQKLEKSLEED